MLLFCVWKLHFVEDYILQYEQEERHLCPAMIKLRWLTDLSVIISNVLLQISWSKYVASEPRD